jgi:hypothetical protein
MIINFTNELKLKNDPKSSGKWVRETNTGINKKERNNAIISEEKIIANDSQRNCTKRFEFVAPATFLNPASFPLFK